MWYEVPKSKPKVEERPPPIFPWEKERDLPPPSRVFAEDLPSPTPEPAALTMQPGAESAESGQIGRAPSEEETSFQGFASSTNVWDAMPDINRYVQNVVDIQQRKNRPRVIGIPAPNMRSELVSPDAPGVTPEQRRASLILTDFPTEVERPSLPVTPAPRRRSTFWGEERNAEGQLPAAEGVPDQAEWVCPSCGYRSQSAAAFRAGARRLSPPISSVSRAPPSTAPSASAPAASASSIPSVPSAPSTTTTITTSVSIPPPPPKQPNFMSYNLPSYLAAVKKHHDAIRRSPRRTPATSTSPALSPAEPSS